MFYELKHYLYYSVLHRVIDSPMNIGHFRAQKLTNFMSITQSNFIKGLSSEVHYASSEAQSIIKRILV